MGEQEDEDAAAWDGDAPLETQELALDDGDHRLPWLESDEDDDVEGDGGGRMFAFVAGGLVLLLALVGGIWWATHRSTGAEIADGSVIRAPAEPYKTAPANPGGKPMAGTGDTAYAVSAGQTRPPKLASGTPTPAPTPTASAKPGAAPAASAGPGVQIGAFSSQAAAEAAWARLSAQYNALKGLHHRIISASADIGTVYRLQAVAGDAAAANALCGKLKGAGLPCQVK